MRSARPLILTGSFLLAVCSGWYAEARSEVWTDEGLIKVETYKPFLPAYALAGVMSAVFLTLVVVFTVQRLRRGAAYHHGDVLPGRRPDQF